MQEYRESGTRPPRWRKPATYLIVGFVAALASVLVYAAIQYIQQRADRSANGRSALDNTATAEVKQPLGSDSGLLMRTSESFRLVAKKVGPAVVNIKSTKGAPKGRGRGMRGNPRGRGFPQQRPGPDEEGGPGGGPGGGGDPFFDFFERFGPFMMPDPGPQTSLGSGIIIDKKGIVVTNNHVVEDATEILVNLTGDKTEMKAKVIGTDPKTDLAVLRLEGQKDFPAVDWADSDKVEVGDWAIAIGSPFALGQSLTVGVVSAKGNRNSALTGVEFGGDLIQTDAAINPGNSGGPLCDVEGKVMGVNTAIYTRSGGYMGIGFAIPSNLAKEVVGKLVADGKIVRGWLGVLIQPLNDQLAKELGLKEGVSIHEVLESSPAAKAGIKAGDVVLEVEGKAITEVNQLQRIIGSFKPGQSVRLKVMSYDDKKTRSVSVKVGELPKDTSNLRPESTEAEPDKLGILVGSRGKEVIVTGVQPGTVADSVGLEQNDVIVRINRKPVDSIAAYKKLIASSKQLYLEIARKGRTLFFQFTLPE